MGKPKHGKKRGFGRPRTNEIAKKIKNKRTRRNHCEDDAVSVNPSSPSDSAASSEELLNNASEDEQEEVAVYKEPTMYDNLLKSLASTSESIANAYLRRHQAEEGKDDTDEEEESLRVSKEDEDVSENESEDGDLDLNDRQETSLAVMDEHDDDDDESSDDGDDDDDDDDKDDEEEMTENGHSIAEESESSSSFSAHLDYKITKEEVQNLSTKKRKYKWAFEAANCKWIATREYLEDSNTNPPYGLNMKLYDHWLNHYNASGGHDFHSSRQRSFFSLCNSYRDILHHNKKPFYNKGREEDSNIMDAYLLHSLNHVFKTRDLVTKNDKTLAKHKESKSEEILNSEKFLDHGFTRPKVLILLPMASIVFRVINRLIQLTPEGHKVSVDHIGRFSDKFGGRRSDDQEDEDGTIHPWKKSKPLDHQTLFKGKNDDDDFMFGIKFTKKTIKLYSDFYTSDILVASPLTLITKMEAAEADKEKDVDYLSSIEVLIIDHVDLFTMQNWSLMNTVVERLNHIPSKQHGTDIMRIRPWYLDGQARFYRQTIILGSYVNPDINSLFNNHCLNYEGKVNLSHEHKGVLPKVLLQVTQMYERIDTKSLNDNDARLDYFKKKIFPKIKDSVQGGIMLFISSYFEYVQVRNFMKSQDASMCLLGEYTEKRDISRSRVSFFNGKKKIMLYTERAHFYNRFKIRGIQNLIIYSLPERKEFYPEIVNMLEGSHSMNCTVLFSRIDRLRLERIVGVGPAKRMLTSDQCIFTFC